MNNVEAQVDALLIDPITVSRYISLFDREIKESCIRKSEFFARCLVSDSNPEIRMLCASLYESLALNLIEDTSSLVRKACAENWESCAKYLVQDADSDVREGCLEWTSCYPLIFDSDEDDWDILKVVCLSLFESEDESLQKKASSMLEDFISDDEEFAFECMQSTNKYIRLLCARHWRSCALMLIDDHDSDVVSESIAYLLEDNDWYCLGSEELVRLCHIDERLAEAILDDHLDDWDVRSACVQLYESCAIRLVGDTDYAIAEYARSVIAESNNQALKLKILRNSSNSYQYASLLLSDKDPEVRKACVRVDEDFALQLVNDLDVEVRLACLEYESCVEYLLNDEEVQIRKTCAQYYSGAIQLMNDDASEVRKICAEHYQCALGLVSDHCVEVREAAIATIEGNKNLSFNFDDK